MVVGFITTSCHQCISPLALWLWIPLRPGVLDTTLCDKMWLAAGLWFSLCTSVSSNITEILLKVALNTIYNSNPQYYRLYYCLAYKKYLWSLYNDTSKLNLLGTNLCVGNRQVFSLNRSLVTTISFIGTLLQVCFLQERGWFKVLFRQVSIWQRCMY